MTSNIGRKSLNSWAVTFVLGVATVLTIAAVSIPNLLRSRVAANEASAVGSIRTLDSALSSYNAQHSDEGFPQKLSDLSSYIDPVLAEGQKSGYSFRYTPDTPDVDGLVKAFRVDAVPISPEAGQRRFSSDESGEIRYQASLSEPERPLDGGSPRKTESTVPRTSSQLQQAEQRTSTRTIRKASLNLVVAEPLATAEKVRSVASRLGGYVESERSSDEGTAAKESSIVVRVPAGRLDEARREVRQLGDKATNEQDDARDISGVHVDLESHLRNYKVEEAQYLDIMRRSGTIKDTLAVSERLADVRGRIERTQGQLDQLANQTEMARLEVNLRTEIAEQPADVSWHPIREIKVAFSKGADDLSTYANFMIEVLFRLPVFLLWTVTLLGSLLTGLRIVRWMWRRFAPALGPSAPPIVVEASPGA